MQKLPMTDSNKIYILSISNQILFLEVPGNVFLRRP